MLPISCPRIGAGVLDHFLKASPATTHASRTCSLVASGNVPITSSRRLELRDSNVAVLVTLLPPMRLAKVLAVAAPVARACVISFMKSPVHMCRLHLDAVGTG